MISTILEIVNKFVPDSKSRDKLKTELQREVTKQMSLQQEVILKEASGGSRLTRNWRPFFMVVIGFIIICHWLMYDVVPWFNVVFDLNIWVPQDPGLSSELWTTMRLGLGGYIGGRSVEKIAKIIKS